MWTLLYYGRFFTAAKTDHFSVIELIQRTFYTIIFDNNKILDKLALVGDYSYQYYNPQYKIC
jgi:hypothetical protein